MSLFFQTATLRFSLCEQMMNLSEAMPIFACFCDIFKRVAKRHSDNWRNQNWAK